MNENLKNLIADKAKLFCFNFLYELNNLKKSLGNFDITLNDFLPEVFKAEDLEIDLIYSIDRNNVFIIFNNIPFVKKQDVSTIRMKFIEGNVFSLFGNIMDYKYGQITMENCHLNGFKVGYGIAITYTELLSRSKNIESYVSDFASFYWTKGTTDSNTFLNYLSNVKNEIKRLFFDETIGELEIDNFIETHPIILQRTLHLVPLNHQAVLKNILNKYEHDLKPDLLAYNELDKCWVIVDYKKAKRHIIKNLGKVRTGFRAEVHGLKDQLRDYREYFFEKEHRDYVLEEYGVEINYPRTIGIIGNVSVDEEMAFNRLIADEPNWYKVVPYNYLYDSFVSYVDLAEQHLKQS